MVCSVLFCAVCSLCVQVAFEGMWYSGVLAGRPRDDMGGKYRWRVQADADRDGMWTYSNDIRKPRSGSKAIGRGSDTEGKVSEKKKGRVRRLRKIQAVEEEKEGAGAAEGAMDLDDNEDKGKQDKLEPTSNSGIDGPTIDRPPRRFSG